jgi:ferric-dicitrate binding protein FerR (iron transport regulator)
MEGWWQFGKPSRFGGETWWSALMIVSLAMCWLTGMLYTDDMTIGDVVGLVLAALHINSILLVWSKAPQEGL